MGSGDNLAQRMKQMQDTALRKAKEENQKDTETGLKEEVENLATAGKVKEE